MLLTNEQKETLNKLWLIQNDHTCIPALRYEEQQVLIKKEIKKYTDILNSGKANYPETQCKFWNQPPYKITDIEFSTPPYAEGKPLTNCVGWTGMEGEWGQILSITIQDGKGQSKRFASESIDKNNCIVFEQNDMTIKYAIQKGSINYSQHKKQIATKPKSIQTQRTILNQPKTKLKI